jgi:hypothetical protein
MGEETGMQAAEQRLRDQVAAYGLKAWYMAPVQIHDESGSVTGVAQSAANELPAFLQRQLDGTVSGREMDLRNMRALLEQKDARIAELMARISRAAVDHLLMSSENGALSDEVERLKRDLENLRPKPSREAPHNPWGRVHDGRAPDVGEPR